MGEVLGKIVVSNEYIYRDYFLSSVSFALFEKIISFSIEISVELIQFYFQLI